MYDAPSLLKLPKSECLDTRTRLPRYQWPISWHTNFKNQWFFGTDICLDGLLCERQFEKVFLENGWGKHQPGNVCLCMVSKVHFCPCTWMTSKWQGRSRLRNRCGKILMREVDLEKPTQFLDQVNLDVLNVKASRTMISSTSADRCSSHEFPQEQLKNCQVLGTRVQTS